MDERNRLTRRGFLRLSALGAIGGLLAACAPQAPATKEAPTSAPAEGTALPEATAVPEPTAAPAAEPIELRWLDWGDQDDIIKMAQDTFKAKHPNVTINYEPIGDEWGDKQLAQMVSGTAPDILAGGDDPSYMWAEKDQLLDLNPLVDRDLSKEQIADFFEYQWNGLIHPSKKIRMGLPYYPWVYQYYYNADAFDEAGLAYPTKTWTIDDYSMMLEKLTKKDASGQITRWGGQENCYGTFRFQVWLHIFGATMVDPQDWTRCAMSSQEGKAALEWHRHRLWDTNTLVQALQIERKSGLDVLATEKVAIQAQGSGDLLTLLTDPPKFNWSTANPPIGPTGKPTGVGTIDNWGIWAKTKGPEMAWEFVKYLTFDDDIQMAISSLWGNPANRKSLLPKFKEALKQQYPQVKDDQVDPQVDQLTGGYITAREKFKLSVASDQILQPALEKIFIVGDSPVSIIDAVCEEITALNQKEG